jgi:GAF domain-containing protein
LKRGKTQVAKAGTAEQRFVSNLAEILASALDERAMVSGVARLLVPRLGDLCVVDVIDDDGSVQRVDRALDEWQLVPTPSLRAGETLLIPDITPSALGAITADPAGQAAMRGAGIRSLVLLPLIGRGRLLGVLTLAMTRPDRAFGKQDLPLLEDIAQRTALGADNARLHQQARQAQASGGWPAPFRQRNGLNTVLTAVGCSAAPPDDDTRRPAPHRGDPSLGRA